MLHKCFECNKTFTRKYYRNKHFNNKHVKKISAEKRKLICPFCTQNNYFETKEKLVLHVDNKHLDSLTYIPKQNAFNGKITIFIKQLVTFQSLENFISNKKNLEEIFEVVLHQLSKFDIVKIALFVTADYRIPSLEQDSSATEVNNDSSLAEERDNFTLRTAREIFNVNETKKSVVKKIRHLLKSLLEREQDLLMKGSGWQFESLHTCGIEIVNHNTISKI